MKDSKEFFSLQDVREYFYDLNADTELSWGGALSLLVGICCVIYGTRYIKRSAESYKMK